MEWLRFILALLTAVVTAWWAVKKWTQQREADRDKDRKKLSALYVLPFLTACEELQSRLYNILVNNGLIPLRARSPEKAYAEETVYLCAQYFGWERCVRRYGTYTQDSVVVKLTEAVRWTFSTDKVQGVGLGAFCFFRPEQKMLAQMVMKRASGEFGPEFETVPFHEFRKAVSADEMTAASCARPLNALRAAENADTLEDRHRLAEVQNHLVDMLSHIEQREGFSLFPKARKKAPRDPRWVEWSTHEGWS